MITTTYESNGRVTVADKPIPTALEMTRASLTLAVITETPARRINRGYYKKDVDYAAIDRTIAEMESTGCSLAEAVNDNFSGALLHRLMNRIKRG